jgi:regulator of replication initiation timing
MGLGLRQSRYHDRRRRRSRLFRWVLALGGLGALAAVTYTSGSELANRDVHRLEQEVAALSQQIEALRAQNARLAGDNGAAILREQDLRRRYEAEVPTGPARDLLALVDARLKEGVSAERIRFMLDAAAQKQACDGKPQTKRFIVQTPISSGANASVGFANSAITVTAQGESASSAGGAPEAWFDPAKPVTLVFAALGGERVQASGVLPLHRSVVYNGDEYRFTATLAETRGFVTVTADRCALPK